MSEPAPTPSRYSDGTYLSDNPDWHAEHSEWKAAHIANLMQRNGIAPRTLCEIGCGAGGILAVLQKAYPGTVFTGYDISPQANAIAKAKANPTLSFHLANLFEEPDSVHFDVVMAIDVFEHVEDYMGFLRKLRGKGEHKIFHIPLDLSAQGLMRPGALMNARNKVGHLHCFTRETALATLADCGYEVVDDFFTSRGTDLAYSDWKTNLMKLPRAGLSLLSKDFAARLLGGFSLMVLAR